MTAIPRQYLPSSGTSPVRAEWQRGLSRKRPNLPFQPLSQFATSALQVVVCLQSHPERLTRPEIPSQTQRGIGRDRPFLEDDLINAPRRYADSSCKPVLTDAKRLEKLLPQHLSWVDVWKQLRSHNPSQW